MRRSLTGLALFSALFFVPGLARAQDNPFSSCQPSDITKFQGMNTVPVPDKPDSTRIHLTGNVVIPCNDTTLFADDVVFDRDTHVLVATGHVNLQQKDLSIYADHAEINSVTKLGRFFNAQGTARLADKPTEKSLFGTLEPDAWFWGDEIAKTGPTTYRLINGGFTTCVQPTRRWEMHMSKGTMTLDKHVVMHNMILKVKDVPLLYLPAIYYPINKEGRSTGFLLPTYGSSTLLGTSLSNAFFLVINRSQDATFYHDWYAKSGQGLGADYRYVGDAGARANFRMNMLDQHTTPTDGSDASATGTNERSYRVDGDLNQGLPHNFRLVGRANFFTDVQTQQLSQDINDYSQRQRSFTGNLSGSLGRVRISVVADQQDFFNGTTPGTRTGHAPSATVSLTEKPIGKSKIYFGASGEVAYLVRQDDISDPTTNRSLARFDGGPSIRAPLSTLPYLTATATASWRLTRWLESYDPLTGLQVPVALNRQLMTFSVSSTGPVFSRVFDTPKNGYAERFKHVIEPSFSIDRSTPFSGFDRIVLNDYAVDALFGGDTRITYGLTNRLLARRKVANAPAGSAATIREILSVAIQQTYHSNSLATSYDQQYQSSTPTTTTPTASAAPNPFTAMLVTAIARPTDRASAQFQMAIDPKARAIQTLSASTTVQSKYAQVTANWSKRQFIPDAIGFDDPNSAAQFVNGTTVLKTSDNRLGGTYSLYYDVKDRSFIQQRIVAYYNSQCCGISFDYQSMATPFYSAAGIPSDRRFGVSFTLAGIGSFSNPLGSFGGR